MNRFAVRLHRSRTPATVSAAFTLSLAVAGLSVLEAPAGAAVENSSARAVQRQPDSWRGARYAALVASFRQ